MIRLLVGGRGYAIYRLPNDELLCTDELYTHAQVDLSRGFVTDV